jgi:hypothetical protein
MAAAFSCMMDRSEPDFVTVAQASGSDGNCYYDGIGTK